MADAAVSPEPELESLSKMIITEANESQDMEAWIKVNLRTMRELCGRIESLKQVPGNADDLVEKIRMVIRRSEDVNDRSKEMATQIRSGSVYEKLIYRIKMRDLTQEIKKIKVDTINTVTQLRLPLRYNFAVSDDLIMPRQLGLSPVDGQHLNYRDIPFYLRQCMYYFLLFPANFKIPARRLVVLWVAEGLVGDNSRESPEQELAGAEQVAGRYLDELIERKVISAVRKLNGNVKSCQLTDGGQRDTLLEMAKEARFFHYNAGLTSRLVDHYDSSTRDSCFIRIDGRRISPATLSGFRDVLSLLSFNNREGSKPGEDIGDFLQKCISAGCFRLMRVLDLEGVFRPKLPKALGKLTLLRYLGLRWTYLEYLPDFVNKLFNLQVLDVKHTYISILPKSVWTMQYLRHLYLSETYRTKLSDRPSGSISLDNLQTLWGASIDEDTCVEGGLDALEKIRKLGLSCRSGQQQLQAINKWISKLKFLETLRLKSLDEDGRPSHLHLTSLRQNKMLTSVYLLGKLDSTVVSQFPKRLVDITLSGSELAKDPMEYLGKLPNLLILRLLSRSVADDTIRCQKDSFPSLQVLKIWKLENLHNWEAEESSLRSLKELEIRSCESLEKLPDRLQRVLSLQKLRVKSMPKRFIDAINKIPHLGGKLEHVP